MPTVSFFIVMLNVVKLNVVMLKVVVLVTQLINSKTVKRIEIYAAGKFQYTRACSVKLFTAVINATSYTGG